jgi:hypothetical protein
MKPHNGKCADLYSEDISLNLGYVTGYPEAVLVLSIAPIWWQNSTFKSATIEAFEVLRIHI